MGGFMVYTQNLEIIGIFTMKILKIFTNRLDLVDTQGYINQNLF